MAPIIENGDLEPDSDSIQGRGDGHELRLLAVLLAVALLLPVGICSEERISCFAIGWVSATRNPFTGFFRLDPLFTYSAEPIRPLMSKEEKQKLDRVYFPRSREALVEGFQVMVFVNARITHFTSRQFADLDFAFREGGMSAICTFGPDWDLVWKVSELYDIVPVKEYYMEVGGRSFKVRFRRERRPVFMPFVDLGLEEVVGTENCHTMEVKQGATIWADIMPYDQPWLVSWEPGGGNPGMQWILSGGLDWFGEDNPYAVEFVTNLVLHSLGRPLIQDIYARREARRLISEVQSQKVVVLDMADWADSFGADTRELVEKLYALEDDAQEAVDLYLDRDHAAAISRMEEVLQRISLISQEAVEVKDRAMFWIFLSEWLIITSVAMASGLAVWSLMIRRRKFREVGSTRLGRS